MSMFKRLRLALGLALLAMAPFGITAQAQDRGPLRIEITEGVIEPLPIAVPDFVAENQQAAQLAQDMGRVIMADLTSSGLFREVGREAHIGQITSFDAGIQFADWAPINVQALVTGAASVTSDGTIVIKFRLWDVFAQSQLGEGQQMAGPADSWRRMAHKIADQIYSRLTGERGYFDSKLVFVSETGPKNARLKQLAVMDQDGANLRYLTRDDTIVLAPRFSPDASRMIYTSYESGVPKVYLMDINSLERRDLGDFDGVSFAPRFSPDGTRAVLSLNQGANTDIYVIDLTSGARQRLTDSPAIETAPSYSPDGTQIVFESDRGGSQQLYVMPATGGEAHRISFGEGRYGTPVWSPRGDLVAFTKMVGGRFHIGVMRLDGSDERLLTSSFLDEGPTWSPNGRVIMFFRESAGSAGAPQLFSVDITGRNLRQIPTPSFASDPHWSPLLH